MVIDAILSEVCLTGLLERYDVALFFSQDLLCDIMWLGSLLLLCSGFPGFLWFLGFLQLLQLQDSRKLAMCD